MSPRRGQDSNREVKAARAAGVMLAHEVARPVHRETEAGYCRIVEVRLNEGQYIRLIDRARKHRETPGALAGAYVRAGLDGKPVVVDPVDVEDPDHETMKSALAASVAEVKRLNARALHYASTERLLKRRYLEAREELATAEAAIHRLNSRLSEHENVVIPQDARIKAQAVDLETTRQQLESSPAPVPVVDPVIFPARAARALKAAGNSPAEIARELGVPLSEVRSFFASEPARRAS